jgi:lipid II:glycine glycyltransferase (peptidoglycan interpeptide bridge formation enzyme)
LIDQLPSLAYFDHSFDPGVTDAVAFSHRGYVVGSTYCFRVAAGAHAKDVWAEMTDRRRRVIRRASEDFGAEPFDDIEEFSRFYEANLGTAENIHGAARLRSLLRAMMARGAGTMLGARDPEGNLVAAVTLVWDAQAMYYLLGSRRPDVAENGATSMLIWKGVQDACERGLTFDFDGATSPTMLQFLAGFGGTLTQRLRVRHVNRTFRLINMVQSMVRRRPETSAPASG